MTFARSVVVSTAANVASPLSILLASAMVAQLFGPTGRGEVAAVNAVIVLAVAVASLGAPEALTYFIARNGIAAKAPKLAPLAVTLIGGSVITVATVGFSGVLSGHDPQLALVIQAASLTIVPSMFLALLRSGAAGRELWGLIAFERYVAAGARIAGLAIPFALGILTVNLAAVILVAAPLLGAVCYLWLPRQAGEPSGVRFGAFTGFALRSWSGTLAGMLAARLSQALLLPLSDAYQLGLFAVAVNLAEVLLISNQAFRDVVFASDSRSNDVALLARASRISGSIALVTAIAIALTSPMIIPLLFGEEFVAAVPMTAALSLGLVLGIPGSVAGMGLGARGRPGLRSVSLVAGLATNLTVLLVLAPIIGAWGAIIASIATSAVTSNLNFFHLRRHFGLRAGQFLWPNLADLALLVSIARRMMGKD
ncbi:polysaccharide biosynthesis C-terminal domain-containing protein [Microbacterium marmarense]|uniref:Polysaccharide biosynthesis C-terminal domain-containing protein n=1 Tax=Microbacterium marmarense TaxID=3122051 RepID=A0ABU8LUV2_9MICO